MWTRTTLAALVLIPAVGGQTLLGEEPRYFEKDGVTYRETREVVQRPMAETRLEQREQTVYREQLSTQVQETYRTYQTPVTEYQLVTVLRGRWNPFVLPYLSNEMVPVRRWETRQEIVRTPVARRDLVPETRVVQVPVTTHRIVEEEVIRRVAVTPPGGTTSVGGVARLENDPPRQGSNWRSSTSTVQR